MQPTAKRIFALLSKYAAIEKSMAKQMVECGANKQKVKFNLMVERDAAKKDPVRLARPFNRNAEGTSCKYQHFLQR